MRSLRQVVARSLRAFATERNIRTKAAVGLCCGIVATGLLVPAMAGAATKARAHKPAAERATKSPFVFGISLAESGPLGPVFNGVPQFITAWFDYVNAHGGIQGHPVRLVTLDDAADPGRSLLNVETLWTQNHVLGLMYQAGTFTPWSYIKQNNIPTWSLGAGTGSRGFASYYPTWFSTGSLSPVWESQAAYWSVKIEHKHPRVVAVLYNQTASVFNSFIENFWHKLGAVTVGLDPGSGTPSTDCTATVLKWKNEGVQYIDFQDNEWPSCLLAEERLGWKPPMGQGSESTSQIGEAQLLGKSVVGVIAGSPNTLYTGAPIFAHPTAAARTYVGAVRKYAPQFANYSFLNGTVQMSAYDVAQLVTALTNVALTKYHRVTPALLVKTTQQYKNWDGFPLDPPVAGFTPNCRTGGEGTIWGYWAYNPHPTAAKPSIYEVPASGPNWITTRKFLGLGKCYLTQMANQLYPNG